ncbi:MAG: CinA family nicotinamide mononucleotide deamidase-related protein [Bacteroidota bacterium]|nr:CinA family nicotinamide mononucleotide deamidase-related protein [Bacteroidota bacterium]
MTNASIITIGDELLIGQVIDTNSAWMAQELNKAGIWVKRRVAVGDSRDEIWRALDEEAAVSEIILITGGLGPTADDITKPLLCDYFHTRLIVNEDALQNVKYIFETVLQRPMIERNLKQAEVPESCRVIQNKRGTAPGMLFERDGKIFVSMPGVPHEMKGMMTDEVIPFLQQKFKKPFIAHRTLLTAGVGESYLADHIHAFESGLPPAIRLAYLPGYAMVRLRLTGLSDDADLIRRETDVQFSKLKELVKEWMVTDEDVSLQEALGKLLKTKNKTLATAESCTGGYVAHLLTSIPGSSGYFRGGLIPYHNDIKEKVLQVQGDTLSSVGAVSEKTVREMITGALNLFHSDYALATSGIMGPDGGTESKPVGTVWIAAGNRHITETRKLHFRFDRQRNIELTATNVLNLLRKFILSQP